jgi:fibronectin type 3 domain-containing protein
MDPYKFWTSSSRWKRARSTLIVLLAALVAIGGWPSFLGSTAKAAEGTDLTAEPNDDNTAIHLTWTVPQGYEYAYIYRLDPVVDDNWVYQTYTYGTQYTDWNVYLYENYTYKIEMYDRSGELSGEPQTVSAALRTEGPIIHVNWWLPSDGVYGSQSIDQVDFQASFIAEKDITDIGFTYSDDGVQFKPFPIIREYGKITYGSYNRWWTRWVSVDLSDLADGEYTVRATATDADGRTFSADHSFTKDTQPPAQATNLNVAEVEGKLQITWTNPVGDDFSYSVLERNQPEQGYGFTNVSYGNSEESAVYTDSNILPGVLYGYRVSTYDKAGNRSFTDATVTRRITVSEPNLVNWNPSDNTVTRNSSIYYYARYTNDREMTSIQFEYSVDGTVWSPMNLDPKPYMNGVYYQVDGYWDVPEAVTQEYQVRITATDRDGRKSVSPIRTVTVDYTPPAQPTGMKVTNESSYIKISWDPPADVNYYYLYRYQNGILSTSWYIGGSGKEYNDRSASENTVYEYRLFPYDVVGNVGEPAIAKGSFYTGPELIVEGDQNAYSSQTAYTIKGRTNPGAALTVNGAAVTIDGEGRFEYPVTLTDAETSFTITAADSSGTNTLVHKVTMDTAVPTVTVLNPSDNTIVSGKAYTVTAHANDSTGSGVSAIVLEVSRDDGATWIEIGRQDRTKLTQSSYWDASAQRYLPYWNAQFVWDTTVAAGDSPLPDGAYKFRAVAYDMVDNASNGAPVRIWGLDNTPPAAPAGLAVTAGVEQNTLSWNHNTETDRQYYRVYRSTTQGMGYVRLAQITQVNYTDRPVSSGTTYYYVVTAVDRNGNESPYSSEAVIVPREDTTPPNISVNVSEGQIIGGLNTNLYFSGSDDSIRGIKTYTIDVSEDNGVTWAPINGSPSTYYYFTWNTAGYTSGAKKLRFRAIDHSNNVSEIIRNVTLDVDVSKPQNVTATAGEGSVTIQWDASEEADFYRYYVYRSTIRTGHYSSYRTITDRAETEYIDRNLDVGRTYYYKVVQADKFDNRAESDVVWAAPIDDVTAPAITSIKTISPIFEDSTGGPTIHFQVKATDNKAVRNADFVYSIDGGTTWEKPRYYYNGPYGPYQPDNYYQLDFYWDTKDLVDGDYKVRVTVGDAAGNENSLESDMTLDLSVSQAVVTAAPAQDGIVVSWGAVADSDLQNTPYRVYRSANEGVSFEPISGWLNRNNTSYKDVNVLPDRTYLYVVHTRDRYGNISQSEPVAGSMLEDQQAPIVTNFTPQTGVTIGGERSQSLVVYFTDNTSVGTTASIEYSNDEGETWKSAGAVSGPHNYSTGTYYFSSSWDLRGLTSGMYHIRFKIRDASGNETEQTALYQVDRTAPEAPGDLIGGYGAGVVNLQWRQPADADVNRYRVYRATSQAGPFQQIVQLNGRENTTYTDRSVTSGLTYYYQVTAMDTFNHESVASNIAGAAARDDIIPPTVLGLEPAAGARIGPSTVIRVRAEDNLILSSITLQYSTDDGETWTDIATKSASELTQFTWNPMPVNGIVDVRAIAKDTSGNVSDGQPVRRYTADSVGPAQVTGVSYTAAETSVLLKWNDVPDQDFSYFRVERKDEADGEYVHVGTVSTQLGMNMTGLAPNKTYWFRVVAYDLLGNRGTPSEEVEVMTSTDDQAPVITDLQPRGGHYSSKITLQGTASDNVGVASIAFQYSANGTAWTDIGTVSDSRLRTTVTLSYEWDISGIAEGIYYVRGLAKDAAGRVSVSDSTAPSVQLTVDRTAPAKTTGLTITADVGEFTLAWEQGSELDLKAYNVYRSASSEGPFELIAANHPSLAYRDRQVEQGTTYYYQVAAVDTAGNVGTVSDVVSGQLQPDNEEPIIVSISPASGSKLGGNPMIHVLAADNYRLKWVTLEYKSGPDADDWTVIGTEQRDVYSDIVTFVWDTAGLADGVHTLRASAVDAAGNAGAHVSFSYDMNVVPPAQPVLTATPGGWKMDLSWTSGGEEDLAGFRLYRKATADGAFRMIAETTGTSYTDAPLAPGTTYYYAVEALDRYRNASRSAEVAAAPTTEDPYAPVADAGDDRMATVGVELLFDGTGSRDNDRISSYAWSFGDGATSAAAQPRHTYTEPGIYTVTLTVSDSAGNKDTASIQVDVREPQKVGTLKVRVLDDSSGAGISGASVVIQYAGENSHKVNTDGSGDATIVAEAGEYKVFAYKTDFMPAAVDAVVELNQLNEATVRLKRGQLVVGELEVRRLTLDEIKDKGVDVNAPENQWVYMFEVHPAFNNQPLPPTQFIVNGMGGFVGGAPAPLIIPDGVTGGGGGGTPGTLKAYPVVIPHQNRPEVRPTIAYMVIPGEARWLKEFFEVALFLENTAEQQFVIEHSTAELNLPNGLALAPTHEPQSLKKDLGRIEGGGTGEAKWIIRGDKKGEYMLEATFNGVLMPFEDAVQTLFKTSEPFRVWGEDALKMHVDAQDRADQSHPYHVRFGLENVSDVPVYNAAIELKDETNQNYIYGPNQELVRSIRTLEPGAILWADYMLIPSISGTLDLSNSYTLKTGGNAEVPTVFTSHSKPENAPGIAPVLRERHNPDGTVVLTWDPVTGAEGYRIYQIREDTRMSRLPELVHAADADETSVTLNEPDGHRNYAINTVLAGKEVLRHAVNWTEEVSGPEITVNPMEVPVGKDSSITITVRKAGFPVEGGKADIGELLQGVVLDSNGQATVTIHPNTAGAIVIKAYDAAGNYLISKTIAATGVIDTPPTWPVDKRLHGLSITETSMRLQWTPAQDDLGVTGYRIYMAGNVIDSVYGNTNSYELTGLTPGTLYSFKVEAGDASGQWTTNGPSLNAMTLMPSIEPGVYQDHHPDMIYSGAWTTQNNPSFHGGSMKFTGTGSSHAKLTFTGNAIKIYSFKSKHYGIAEVFIDDVSVGTFDLYSSREAFNQLVFERIGLADGEHTLRIVRTGTSNPAAEGSGINIDYIVVEQLAAVPAPTGLKAAAGDAQVGLSWDPVIGAASYELYRSTSSVGGYQLVQSTVTSAVYDHSVMNGTTYYYAVKAIEESGRSSSYSSQVSAKPFWIAGAGVYENNNSALSYRGAWTTLTGTLYSDQSITSSGSGKSSVSLTFQGSSIRVYGFKHRYHGIAEVYIDGQLVDTIDYYDQNTLFQQLMFEKHGLGDGPHTIELVRTGLNNSSSQGSAINIDYFQVGE